MAKKLVLGVWNTTTRKIKGIVKDVMIYPYVDTNGKIAYKIKVIKKQKAPEYIEFEHEWESDEDTDEEEEMESYNATIKTPNGNSYVSINDTGYVQFNGKGYKDIDINIISNNELQVLGIEHNPVMTKDELYKYLDNLKSDKLPSKASQAIKQIINEYNNNEINWGY